MRNRPRRNPTLPNEALIYVVQHNWPMMRQQRRVRARVWAFSCVRRLVTAPPCFSPQAQSVHPHSVLSLDSNARELVGPPAIPPARRRRRSLPSTRRLQWPDRRWFRGIHLMFPSLPFPLVGVLWSPRSSFYVSGVGCSGAAVFGSRYGLEMVDDRYTNVSVTSRLIGLLRLWTGKPFFFRTDWTVEPESAFPRCIRCCWLCRSPSPAITTRGSSSITLPCTPLVWIQIWAFNSVQD